MRCLILCRIAACHTATFFGSPIRFVTLVFNVGITLLYLPLRSFNMEIQYSICARAVLYISLTVIILLYVELPLLDPNN